MNDKELVCRMQNGSKDAFNRIYAKYARKLYLYSFQYVKSREDAEEIVQDVFVKLWVYRRNILNGELLNAFIFRIAKNQIINRYKSCLRSAVYEEYVEYCNDIRFSVADAAVPLEYDDFCKRLNKAMESLTDTQRKAVDYVKIQNFTIKEAAEKLRLKEQTVKNAVTAGLKTLRQILGGEGGRECMVVLIILNFWHVLSQVLS